MRFLFHDDAGSDTVVLKGEAYKYVVKVRRHREGETVALRRRDDEEMLHLYRIESIDGRRAALHLASSKRLRVGAEKTLHIGWCVIDPRSVEKVLPQLNELGVTTITFIDCDRSQRQFSPDFDRLNRILDASMQQCGRSVRMRLARCDSIEVFIGDNPDTCVLDFTDEVLHEAEGIATVLIGCEGGFSEAERQLAATLRRVRFATSSVLRSETAAVAAAVKVLL